MPRVGFEPMNPVFEWANKVHALGRAATVVNWLFIQLIYFCERSYLKCV
jgi:hypothetical protein